MDNSSYNHEEVQYDKIEKDNSKYKITESNNSLTKNANICDDKKYKEQKNANNITIDNIYENLYESKNNNKSLVKDLQEIINNNSSIIKNTHNQDDISLTENMEESENDNMNPEIIGKKSVN
jgi:hypothetical protein